ncbi:helix-turn-helix domain-containing protein [Shimazuella sp. AN120528]|uniref:helix-turn-helix domain-containing protein n=1 Tax=Shimazuella soli TaxID=1892854 RepID=UPI001F0FCFB7|nr:helix-turn-helix domain-containing protein [Shimazuella soli]MCH5584176.1 helix-turn-helix domain-containing protein [Shimazuella soli]
MVFVDLNLVGEAIRNYRKEKRLRLEDLADENISVSTISNIERGFAHVKQEKVNYLLHKLGIDVSDLTTLEQNLQKKDEYISIQLTALESWIVCDEESKALTELNNIKLSDHHPLASRIFFLKGKCHLRLKEWKKAIHAFYESIRLSRLQMEASPMEAACYDELSRAAYCQNDVNQATAYVEKGLELIQENSDIKLSLIRNKAQYLFKQSKEADALKLIKDNWIHLSGLTQMDLILDFYQIRVKLLIITGLWDEALAYAEEGIHLAKQNNQYHPLCVLWGELGKIYMNQYQYDLAEVCFRTSQVFEFHIKDKSALISTYTFYGKLLQEQKEYQMASVLLNKAIQLGSKYNEVEDVVRAFLAIGQVCLVTKDTKAAMEYFHKARDMATEHQLPILAYEAIFEVAKVYQELDSDKFIACTVEMYEMKMAMNNRL